MPAELLGGGIIGDGKKINPGKDGTVIVEDVSLSISVKETVAYGSIASDSTQLEIPAHVEYPDIRVQIPPGSIKQGDTLTIAYTLTDSDGNVKDISNTQVVVNFNDYPSDPNTEVLGVIYASFLESSSRSQV